MALRPHQIKIIEPKSYQYKVKKLMEQGLLYFNEELNQENFEQIMSQHVQPEDILIDLSVNVDTIELINWCVSHHVLYINTGIYGWKTEFKFPDIYDFEKYTLNYAHHLIASLMAKYKQRNCPTIILEHGANPGLVSHLVKKALIDISEYLIDKNQFTEPGKDYLKDKNFQQLSRELSIKVIHISEKDTQNSRFAKQPNEFLNTWSIDGLFWESIAPAEVGWGTHEKIIPFEGELNRIGNKRAVVLKQCGKNVWVKSWVPDENILGMVITHGETLTIHEHLSIKDALGNYIYSPTVHYAYSPTTHTICHSAP